MTPTNERRIISQMRNNENLKAVYVKTSSENFEKRFSSSISLFFKTLTNSKQSVGGVSNREFYKSIKEGGGVFFSLYDRKDFEIIIIYESKDYNVNELGWKTRVKKILGLNTEIQFGTFQDYEKKVNDMVGIVRRSNKFGSYYRKKVA